MDTAPDSPPDSPPPKRVARDSVPDETEAPESEVPEKYAGYCWIKLKLGKPLTEEEKTKAGEYNLDRLIDDETKFCTICGGVDHIAYTCDKFEKEYIRPYGTLPLPGYTDQVEDEKPSDVWTEKDQERLMDNGGDSAPDADYLWECSDVKNIHRELVLQHKRFEKFIKKGYPQKTSRRVPAYMYKDRLKSVPLVKDEEDEWKWDKCFNCKKVDCKAYGFEWQMSCSVKEIKLPVDQQ